VTLVLAHRGANREAPENTLAAFRRALELGADGVELDLRRTVDDALVVAHDGVNRAGVVTDVTRAAYHAHVPDVPLLDAALDACEGHVVNVEIKNSPGDAGFDPEDRISELLVELLEARGFADQVLVSSFHLPSIDRVHHLAPEVPTGHLVVRGDLDVAIDVAAARGHRAIHPAFTLLTREHVARAHELGLAINVWTVNDRAELAFAFDAGVDAVITDVPGDAISARSERSARGSPAGTGPGAG